MQFTFAFLALWLAAGTFGFDMYVTLPSSHSSLHPRQKEEENLLPF